MTEYRTLHRRLNGTYDHWKKWARLRKARPGGAGTVVRRGRRHRSYLRSAIARQLWIMRSRRQPFPFLHS